MRATRTIPDQVQELFAALSRGWRSLWRRPGSSLAVVLLLSLGLGGVLAGLAVAHSTYLDPLPYPESDRLVFLREGSERMGPLSVNYRNFLDWRERNRSFTSLAALRTENVTLGGEEPVRLAADIVSSDLFPILGVDPALGRVFSRAEDEPGAPRVAVLGHALWRERFGGDETVLGHQISLDDEPYTVVGVMPAGFDPMARGKDLWLPVGPFADRWQERVDHEGHWVVGRLSPEVSLEAARRDMERVGAALEQEHPAANEGIRPRLEPLADVVVGDLRTTAALFAGAVALVLAITLANVAGLLLADSAARWRERRVRLALGATRADLTRQHAVEGLLLGLAGALGGAWTAWILLRGLRALGVLEPVAATGSAVDWLNPLVLGGGGAVLVLAIALLSAVPAAGTGTWSSGSMAPATPRGAALGRLARRTLVVGEIAMAFLALVAAGLLWRSLHKLRSVEPGFVPEGAIAFKLTDHEAGGTGGTENERPLQQLEERLLAAPEVAAAGFAQALPLTDDLWKTNFVVGGEPRSLEYALVSPGYFRAMGIPLLRGRTFTERDREGAPWVAVVDRTLADRFWPDGSGVAGTLGTGPGGPAIEVVGVVESVRSRSLASDAPGLVYVPYAQFPATPETTVFVVRGEGELTTTLSPTVDRVVADALPGRPVHDRMQLEELVGRQLSPARVRSLLAGGAGALSTVLAMMGLYGMIAFTTRRRTREIGIRLALGSTPGHVAGGVLREAVGLAAAGFTVGLPTAWMLSRLLERTLYGVTGGDWGTYAVAAIAILALTMAAALLPAVRAARVDPRRTLTSD